MPAKPSQRRSLPHWLMACLLLGTLALSAQCRAGEKDSMFGEGLMGLLVFETYAAAFSLPAIYGPQEYGVLLGAGGAWLAISGYGAQGKGDDWIGPAFFFGLGAYNFLALDPDMPDGELFGKNLLAWNVLGAAGLAYLAATGGVSSHYSAAAGQGRVRWMLQPGGLRVRVDF